MLTGNFLLHRVLHFLLLSENRIFASLHWKNLLRPKTNPKNLSTLTHTPPLEQQTAPQDPPPKRIQKSPYTNPTPPIEQQTHLKRHRARRIQKISVHSPIHTTNWTADDTSKGTLLDSPPQNESKKYPYTHPYTQPIEHQTTPQAAPCPTVPPKKSDLICFLLLCCFFLWCFRFRWNLGSAAWAVALLSGSAVLCRRPSHLWL